MDDFTFPAIPTDQDSVGRESFPHFSASPLWFLSSAAPEEDTDKIVGSENKMDMLWEDFNEEFRKVSDEVKKDASGAGTGEQRVVGLSSKVCSTRASLVVMLKMLKRLFLLQKTNSTKRSSSPFKKL